MLRRLDFGSGYNPAPGFETCELNAHPCVDHDFRNGRITCCKETFDVIRCRNVLHHIKDLDALFQEFRRVLKPGGGILIIDSRPEIFPETVSLDYLWYRMVIPRPDIWCAKEYRDYVEVARSWAFKLLFKMPLCRVLEIAVLAKEGKSHVKNFVAVG